MMESVCGSFVSSRRGLLAFLWSIVTLLTVIAFITALLFSIYSNGADNDGNDDQYYYNNNQEGEGSQDEQEEYEERRVEFAVTSRAMAFAALWTAVLASLMAVFGTVILGFQSPTGDYYTCCDPNVHRTTQLGLGSFIGALLMFANLTLVCSVLFGEFKIRDYTYEGEEQEGDEEQEENNNDDQGSSTAQRSSMAFSIMCMFLTVMYAGFAALTYVSATNVLQEGEDDKRADGVGSGGIHNGYIDGRFDVMPAQKKRSSASSFAPPPVPERHSQLLPANDFQTPICLASSQGSNSTPGRYGESSRSGYVEPNPLFESTAGYVVEPNPLYEGTTESYNSMEPNPFQSGAVQPMFGSGGLETTPYENFDNRGGQSIS